MTQNITPFWIKFVVAFVLSITLTNCTKNKKQEYGLDMRETLRVNLETEPPSLDWSKSTDTVSSKVEDNIMEGLTTYNLTDPDLGLLPALAESWAPAEKGKIWTFKIRKDVKWTDGVELTAQHFVDSWERLLNPATASEYASFLFGIKNAQAYFDKKVTDFAQVGVKAIDAHTLEVTLNQSMSFFPYLTTHHSTYPIRKDVIEKHGDAWTKPENMITLGAYKLKVWDHDKAIVLERNDSYYGEKAKIKNILCYMIVEESTAMNLYETSKLDVIDNMSSGDITKFKDAPEMVKKPLLVLQYYGFNTKKKPFDNHLIRKAFVHAVNREEMVAVLRGGQIPLSSWVPVGMFGHEPERGLKFDPEKAKQYLIQAGFGGDKKLPKITIVTNTGDDHRRLAENFQAQIKKNLGVDIEIANEEWKVFLNRLKVDPPAIFRMGWSADYPDPDNFINLMTTFSAQNYTRWKSKDYDQLVEEGVGQLDKEKRRAIYSRAQKMLVEEDNPVIPLYTSVRHKLINKRVKNYPVNSLDKLIWKNVQLNP
ncbi:MAG: peptide ABC transporter substrate-binding protein [Bdellovibrionales bacterium]